jgi:sec-independent protein translocase protein TatB
MRIADVVKPPPFLTPSGLTTWRTNTRRIAGAIPEHYDEGMNLRLPEMVFILLLALVLVGPKKLPELGRQLGKFLAEFKRASNEFRSQLETEMLNIELEERAKKQSESPAVLPPEQPWERVMRPLTDSVSRTRQELASIITPEPAPETPAQASITAKQHSEAAKAAENN